MVFRHFWNSITAWYRYGTVFDAKTEITLIRPRARLGLFV
nr:MAG TPA: hypothetical protein [Caudoviricetes sp.]